MSATSTLSFKERLRRFLRPPRKLKFTRQGRWFTGMTMLVGIGAINTGNNLLYLMLGMMLGLIIISGIMSETMLRWVRVERISVSPAFATERATLEYRVKNGKKLFPSFSIQVTEKLKRRGDDTKRARAKAKKVAGRDPSQPGALVHRIPAGGSRIEQGDVLLPRRGLFEYESIDVATRFPFGFFEKSRTFEKRNEILVYPRQVPPPAEFDTGERPSGFEEEPRKGRGLEFLGLRDYHAGEDWRSIHWKVTARRGSPVVREHQRELSRTAMVAVLVCRRPDGKTVVIPHQYVSAIKSVIIAK